jgi:hypothetical protein
MNRRFSLFIGTVGAVTFVATATIVDVVAQRGGGGQGRPPSAGPVNPGQGGSRAGGGGNPNAGGGGGNVGNPNQGGNPNAGGGNRGNNNNGNNGQGNAGKPDGAGRPDAVGRGRGNANANRPDGDQAGQGRGRNNAGNGRDAEGFKNYGQLVAARHVSENLGIDFNDLKALMTGDNPKSLGQAIQELRPEVDANGEAAKAERQAQAQNNVN